MHVSYDKMHSVALTGKKYVTFLFLLDFHEVYTKMQGSHKLWKSWKTWKITKKSSMHGKIMEFEKTLNNREKIMNFPEIM